MLKVNAPQCYYMGKLQVHWATSKYHLISLKFFVEFFFYEPQTWGD